MKYKIDELERLNNRYKTDILTYCEKHKMETKYQELNMKIEKQNEILKMENESYKISDKMLGNFINFEL